MDDDSPQLLVDMGNDVVAVMDREMFDYAFGESNASDPAQRDLDELLPGVIRVRALASGMFRGQAMGSEVILDTSDSQALTAFGKTLQIVEDPRTFAHCACLGGPTLELCIGREVVATIGLQHGHSIRWAKWKHDARLRNGQALNDWLAKYGVETELLEVLFENKYDAGGLLPMGFQRSGSLPLTRAEQQVRLAELQRVRSDDLEGALAKCQKVLDLEPGLAFGYAVRALIRHQHGDHASCVADCTEAIRLGLREAGVFYTRAVAQDELGRPQDALADCTTALEVDPNHVGAYNSRGFILWRLGRLDEALLDLNEAIRLAPEWDLPYLNRAQVYIVRHAFDLAIADFDRVIGRTAQSAEPSDRFSAATAFWNRGQCYRSKGDDQRGEADLREALRRESALGNAKMARL